MTDLPANIDAIFFIGPQGSGKGTQAKLLAKKADFFYWEMGGILRGLDRNTDLGGKILSLIDQGVLLGDDLLLEVVKHKLSEVPKGKPVIFDGVPRRIGQAHFLLDHLREVGYKNFVTLFIDLSKEESMKRLLLRAKIENRKDDTEEAIEFRLKQYQEDTLPVLDYLKDNSTFITIDGRPPIEEVTVQIDQALASLTVHDHA